MIEDQTPSCAAFYRLVRDFAIKTKPWSTAIRYNTKPDERFDLTLVSQRVYGRRDEFLAVMAAAGLDSVEQELTERLLTLPTDATLAAFKERAKFANVRRR
jgi:hypothetical protein